MNKVRIISAVAVLLIAIGGLFALNGYKSQNASAVMASSEPTHTLKPSDFKTGVTYEEAMKQKKPMVINFYVDWCHYCQNFAPVLDNMRLQYKDKYNFVTINCEDKHYKKLVDDFMIGSFPTLYIVDPTNDNRVLVPPSAYSSQEYLKKEFNRFLRVNHYNK